ncbi:MULTISPECIES: glycosyltransferase family protein [Vibrio harveyi group]|uniref:glycosyltransferase n=1 Tax=Vibrio harveyi group TaxID=717610 RepID=UPI001E370A00|nr:glycosyltransferase [Vibrio parahaemolyticus]
MTTYAPIVLFAYARPEHTKRTIESILKNAEASETEIYIYIDHPKNNSNAKLNQEVIDICENIKGFKSKKIIKRESNFGLARNIISGVSEIINSHGKTIVMEDDMVVSNHFLNFMNNALDRYKNESKVWHITGWNYPCDLAISDDAFFWRGMNCWAWATWSDRWVRFSKDPEALLKCWDKKTIRKFNIDGTHNFFSQVKGNANGRLNTWAIFWYATIFENDGLCLNPRNSLVNNIGNDGSGVHCGDYDPFQTKITDFKVCNLPKDIYESKEALNAIKIFYKKTFPNIFVRALRKLKRKLS